MSAISSIIPSRSTTVTTAVQSAATALAANSLRVAWSIQNQGTNPLFVKLGASASNVDYTFVLAAGTGAANGTGGSIGEDGNAVYTGIITIAGTAPSYSVYELEEQR